MKKVDCFIYQCQKCMQMFLIEEIRLDSCLICSSEVKIIEQTKLPKSEKDKVKEFMRLGNHLISIFKRIENIFKKAFSEEGQNEN